MTSLLYRLLYFVCWSILYVVQSEFKDRLDNRFNGTPFFFLLLGRVGITLNCDWAIPLDPSNVMDVEAADRRVQFHLGW